MLLSHLYSFLAQAALSHILLRILVLLLVEGECARLVQQSSGKPAVLINFVIIGIYSLAFVLSAAKINIGYIVGVLAGSINIILKLVVIVMGHEHFPNRPYLYLFQSFLVIYFCYFAYKDTQYSP
jgi:hypothetical protein